MMQKKGHRLKFHSYLDDDVEAMCQFLVISPYEFLLLGSSALFCLILCPLASCPWYTGPMSTEWLRLWLRLVLRPPVLL